MAINSELLLFIEPENESSKNPLIDELTMKMTASFRKSIKGRIEDYSKMGRDYEFIDGGGWMGFHVCSCGACAGGYDFLLSNGEMTNGNCIHYLAYHRNEIPEEQLERVSKLVDGQKNPNEKELGTISINRNKKKRSMTRKEYLENFPEKKRK